MRRLLFLLLLAGVAAQAQPIKRLYLANDDHTDYMWSANEAKYDSAFVRMLDFYLAQIKATKKNTTAFRPISTT